MPCIVIVRVRVGPDAALQELITEVNPAREFGGTVEDRPVPRRRLRLDGLAVAEPSHVGPVNRYGIKFQLGRIGHAGLVEQYEGDAVFAEQAGEFGVEPSSIANLDSKSVAVRESFEKGDQPVEEGVAILEYGLCKERELEQDGAELASQQARDLQKFGKLLLTAKQNLFVCDDLRRLERKEESVRSPFRPAANGLRRGTRIERGVDFHR